MNALEAYARPLRATWLPLLVLLVGCPGSDDDSAPREPGPEHVTDTLGVVYRVDEEGGGYVTEDPSAGIAPCDGEPEFTFDWGRTGIAMMCARSPEGGGSQAETCRPLACSRDAECPFQPPHLDSACIRGICQCVSGACPCVEDQCPPPRIDGLVSDEEVVALCLHDTERPGACPWVLNPPPNIQLVADALDACDELERCPVPSECLQP